MNTSQEEPPKPGTITGLEAQKRDPNRVSVFLDGVFVFGVHQKTLLEFALHKGLLLDVATQQEIILADRARAARVVALDYLGYKARTEHEIRQKLARKDFDEAISERTIAHLRERGYVDDAAYTRSFVQSRFKNKGYGPRRLRSDLMRRGIARIHIDAALQTLEESEDLYAGALPYAEKRWKRLAREPDPQKRRKKLSDYLLRRGYTYDVVRQIVDTLVLRDA